MPLSAGTRLGPYERFSIAARSWSAIPSARWRTCNKAERSCCREIRPRARTAYQDFLTLWKDADPDIPIRKQAQAEYGTLQ